MNKLFAKKYAAFSFSQREKLNAAYFLYHRKLLRKDAYFQYFQNFKVVMTFFRLRILSEILMPFLIMDTGRRY